MNKNECRLILASLKAAYPSAYRDMSKMDRDTTVKLWERQFNNVAFDDVEFAVDKHIATSKFVPAISEIKELIHRARTPDSIETAGQAWHKVINAASSFGRDRFDLAQEKLSKAAIEATKAVGWGAVCDCNPNSCDTLRAHFIKAFNESKQVADFEAKTGPVLTSGETKMIEVKDGIINES